MSRPGTGNWPEIPTIRFRNRKIMLKQSTKIINKLGLHARAATKFANTANRYSCNVYVINGEKKIDGKSIMALMLLAAAKGTELTLSTDGKDEEDAMKALLDLIENRFEEQE